MNWKILFLLAVAGSFFACKDKRKDLVLGAPAGPSIEGTWSGDMTVNAETAHVRLVLKQTDITVKGTYDIAGSANVRAMLGESGRVDGVTTGPAFSMKFLPENIPCVPPLQMGGQNSGSELSFNMTGTACEGETLRGQASLLKSAS